MTSPGIDSSATGLSEDDLAASESQAALAAVSEMAKQGKDFAVELKGVAGAEYQLSRMALSRALLLAAVAVAASVLAIGLLLVSFVYLLAVPMALGWGWSLVVSTTLMLIAVGGCGAGAIFFRRQAGFKRSKTVLKVAFAQLADTVQGKSS